MSDESEVWDYLQPRFGFGDWDETTTDVPWWKFRANGIGQLKTMCRKRRVKPAELVIAAEYAMSHQKPVTALWELFSLVGEANAWRRKKDRLEATARAATDVELALGEAIAAGEQDWAERFMRVGPSEAQTLINEWRAR